MVDYLIVLLGATLGLRRGEMAALQWKDANFSASTVSITQRWERFIAKHHLPDIRLHDLRHSNATALIAAGVSPKVVQHRLGHANVSITLSTYTHVLPSMDEDAAEKLDNALFSTTQSLSHPLIII